jgi:phospholipase C
VAFARRVECLHVTLRRLVDHVVIIVKENHTFDNYFGTFPNSEGDGSLGPAQNPPPDDPDHRHEAWMNRDADQVHRVQYSEDDIPAALCTGTEPNQPA